MTNRKSKVGNVISSYTQIKSMIAKQVEGTTKLLLAKEVPTLVADSLNDILQCTYEKSRTGARYVVYNVVKQIIFDLLRRDLMDKTLDQHIAKYFNTSDTVERVRANVVSKNAFMAPITAFIQRCTSKAVDTECIATEMEIQMKLQTVDADAKHVTKKSSSPLRKYILGHGSHSCSHHRRLRKDKKCSST